MGLLCARLSCRLEAAASLQFNADEAQVIIIDLTEPTGGIPLCADHVRSRTAPVGWSLVDHRLAMPPRRHLESVPQPELTMSMSAPPRPGPEATSNHPAGGDVTEGLATDVVTPTVAGPAERPSQRRPMDRGFPWEWAGSYDDEATADGIDDASDSAQTDQTHAKTDGDTEPSSAVSDGDEGRDDDRGTIGASGIDTTAKPSTPLLSRAFRNNPIDPDEAS